MRRLLVAPLIFTLLSPVSSQANEPKLKNLQETRAAGGLTFVLCKVRQGASQDWATNELETMSIELASQFKESEIDSSIFKRNNVRKWAETASKSDVCNMWKDFKSWSQFKSYYQSVMENDGGDIAFNRLNKIAKKVVKISAESECLFRLKKINSLQRTEYRKNGLQELAIDQNELKELVASVDFNKAFKWYFDKIASKNCKN